MRALFRQLTIMRGKALMFGLAAALGCVLAALIGEIPWSFVEDDAALAARGPAVDVVFVLDHTTSMRAEMAGIKSGLQHFVSELTMRGFDAQVGLIAFSDRF